MLNLNDWLVTELLPLLSDPPLQMLDLSLQKFDAVLGRGLMLLATCSRTATAPVVGATHPGRRRHLAGWSCNFGWWSFLLSDVNFRAKLLITTTKVTNEKIVEGTKGNRENPHSSSLKYFWNFLQYLCFGFGKDHFFEIARQGDWPNICFQVWVFPDLTQLEDDDARCSWGCMLGRPQHEKAIDPVDAHAHTLSLTYSFFTSFLSHSLSFILTSEPITFAHSLLPCSNKFRCRLIFDTRNSEGARRALKNFRHSCSHWHG